LRNAPKADGESRIYIPGEKEQETAERNLREGIPLNRKVANELAALARELEIELEF
jgi:LDH2 family malate/lactate/ureidoglycolate dehydrogenase